MESPNLDLKITECWCLKWYMKLNPKKTKFMVVSHSLANAPVCDDLTLVGAELEELRSLRILGVFRLLTFETYLREVVSKATSSMGVVLQAGKLFDCLHVLKSCFNAYVM